LESTAVRGDRGSCDVVEDGEQGGKWRFNKNKDAKKEAQESSRCSG
jgi:hypothetical protein